MVGERLCRLDDRPCEDGWRDMVGERLCRMDDIPDLVRSAGGIW